MHLFSALIVCWLESTDFWKGTAIPFDVGRFATCSAASLACPSGGGGLAAGGAALVISGAPSADGGVRSPKSRHSHGGSSRRGAWADEACACSRTARACRGTERGVESQRRRPGAACSMKASLWQLIVQLSSQSGSQPVSQRVRQLVGRLVWSVSRSVGRSVPLSMCLSLLAYFSPPSPPSLFESRSGHPGS